MAFCLSTNLEDSVTIQLRAGRLGEKTYHLAPAVSTFQTNVASEEHAPTDDGNVKNVCLGHKFERAMESEQTEDVQVALMIRYVHHRCALWRQILFALDLKIQPRCIALNFYEGQCRINIPGTREPPNEKHGRSYLLHNPKLFELVLRFWCLGISLTRIKSSVNL